MQRLLGFKSLKSCFRVESRPILQQLQVRHARTVGSLKIFIKRLVNCLSRLEIFSLASVRALGSSFLGCYKFFQKLCSGDCQWGEDVAPQT